MKERWIVGTDDSSGSSTALRWALRWSSGRDARIELVRADPRTAGLRLAAALARRWPRAGGRADAAPSDLDPAMVDAGADRVVVHQVIRGPAGPVLVDAAAKASLLVVGRHGSGAGWRHALGSVSRFCATHASVPTVVVPPEWTDAGFDRIVVGFDGSMNSRAALEWALGFAGDDQDVRALIAIEVAPWLQEDTVHLRLGEELETERARLLDLLASADPAGRATADVVVRGAKPALARVAGSADLIVVGARGTGLMAGLGSVSTWLLGSSSCAVVVVPDPGTT